MRTDVFDPATDPGAFAEQLLGVPLWPHQLKLLRSPARVRTVLAGRQAGKSRSLEVLALHEASTRRNVLVMLVSTGEVASRRLLENCAALAAASPLLRGSVLDESKSLLVLSNGSRILSVPASQRQIRGWSVDVLIVDEAAFVDEETWRAAEPTILARPGSRVVLASSPWGGPDHWFRMLFQRGADRPDAQVESFRWPSSISPLVSDDLLEHWRETWPAHRFEAEVLAEWTDDSGAYFTAAELDAATADYELLSPADAARAAEGSPWPVAVGVDWGAARDSNALVALAVLEDHGRNEHLGTDPIYFVPWLEVERTPYGPWIDRLLRVGDGYRVQVYASEVNGVGAYPTEELERRAFARWGGATSVAAVFTENRRKMSAFSQVKGLMQAGRLVLPRHPELLKQMRALEFSQLPSGMLRIAVPEAAGHDDLALALSQAASCIEPFYARVDRSSPRRGLDVEGVTTGSGTWVPLEARPSHVVRYGFGLPSGRETTQEAGW